ncbi:MAG TPA: hypothetical protein ENI78_02690 [Euryarchaeota archaeon]|nr:hypothetical protein [Euryarchaeota archaeon]
MSYIYLEVNASDRNGISKLKFEGQYYEEVKERIKKFVDYIFKSDEHAEFKIEAKIDDVVTLDRNFRRCDYTTALSNILEFLKYIYDVDEVEEERKFESYYEKSSAYPEWLQGYDPANLTQREKVFLLIKHNHPEEWIRSQDIKVEYETIYGESIKLSSLSTYLARFYSSGIVNRRGTRAQREYILPQKGSSPSF